MQLPVLLNVAATLALSIVSVVLGIAVVRRLVLNRAVSLLMVYLWLFIISDTVLTYYRTLGQVTSDSLYEMIVDPVRVVRIVLVILMSRMFILDKLDTFIVVRRKERKGKEK